VPERRYRIVVCRGPECGERRNSRAVHDAFAAALTSGGAERRCELGWQSCFGRCSQGPNVLVRELAATSAPPRFSLADLPPSRGGGPRLATALYSHIDPAKAAEVVATHIERGIIVARFIERAEPAPVRADTSTTSVQPATPDSSPGESDV
jgi:(2Fe-2S) ferredoxin